jgi:hypothetical protein
LALLLGLITMALGLLSLWGRLTIVVLTIDPALSAREAPAIALRRLPAAIGTMIVLLVALMLLWSPVLGFLIAKGYHLTAAGTVQRPPIAGAAALWIGLLGLILAPVTLWLFARVLTILPPVLVTERRVIGAIGRSWRLTRGAAFRIMGVTLLYIVVSSVAVLAAQTVFGSVLRILANDKGPVSIATVITSIIVGFVGAIFSVLGTAFTAKLYLALRDRALPQ